MCGFAGFINFQDDQHPQHDWAYLTQMGQPLRRRGPDDEQVVNSPPLWLIYRRLSIIDIPGGGQPIWNENHTMCVVVNGEIYNHIELRSQLRENHDFRITTDLRVHSRLPSGSPQYPLASSVPRLNQSQCRLTFSFRNTRHLEFW